MFALSAFRGFFCILSVRIGMLSGIFVKALCRSLPLGMERFLREMNKHGQPHRPFCLGEKVDAAGRVVLSP